MGLAVTSTVLSVAFVLTLSIFYSIDYWDPLSLADVPAPNVPSRWWGRKLQENRTEDDEKLHKFTISITNKELEDLRRRLDDTIYVEPVEDARFHYGFNGNYLRTVVHHWRNVYNWTLEQERLNSFDQWTTKINGIRIHYVHVKPPIPKHPKKPIRVIPLLLIHGWPGSFVEFLDMVPLLTTPQDGQDFVFEVVIPSIPGYGFSEAPHRPGFGQVEAAQIFDQLMRRLGFQSYYAQGGDWGSLIVTNMARLYPQRITGVHVNLVFTQKLGFILKLVVGQYVPWMFDIDDSDYKRLYPISDKFGFVIKEMGYYHIQSTKPDTVGLGLTNCPAALAAYILEKFSTWTDKSGVNEDDGKLTAKFNLDRLLTNVMIYWVTGSITSSQRFYKEYFSTELAYQMNRVPVTVAAGVASFPNEIVPTSRLSARSTFTNVVSFTDMPQGGHFAGFEEPHLLAKDIHQFVSLVESIKSNAMKSDKKK